MKKLFIILSGAAIFLNACNNNVSNEKTEKKDSTTTKNFYGKVFENNNATPVNEAVAVIKSGKEFKGIIEGRMMEVCQAAGCWTDLGLAGGEKLKVKFRDANGEEFGIDKASSGKMIDVHGVGYMDTISVEMQKHYAEDDKASKEEIAKIKSPIIKPVFTADGAFIKQ